MESESSIESSQLMFLAKTGTNTTASWKAEPFPEELEEKVKQMTDYADEMRKWSETIREYEGRLTERYQRCQRESYNRISTKLEETVETVEIKIQTLKKFILYINTYFD